MSFSGSDTIGFDSTCKGVLDLVALDCDPPCFLGEIQKELSLESLACGLEMPHGPFKPFFHRCVESLSLSLSRFLFFFCAPVSVARIRQYMSVCVCVCVCVCVRCNYQSAV